MRRLTPLLALWILGTFATVRADEAPAPLRLEAEVKGRWLKVVGSAGNGLRVLDGGNTVVVRHDSTVRVTGDLGAALDCVVVPDGFAIAELPRETGSLAPRVWRGTFSAPDQSWPLGSEAAANEGFRGRAQPLAAALWLVNGAVRRTAVCGMIRGRDGGVRPERATFDLAEGETSGTGAYLVFVDGEPVRIVGLFDDASADRIARLAALGRDDAAAELAGGLRTLPASGRGGVTLLWTSVIAGARQTVLRLLALGAPLDPKGERVQRPIDGATLAARLPVVEELVARKCSLHPSAEKRDGPLHLAISNGHLALAQRLVAAGADIEEPGANGFTPLTLALSGGREELALWLLSRKPRYYPDDREIASRFVQSAGAGQLELMKYFRKRGAKVEAMVHGETALLGAAQTARTEVIDYLLAEGAAVDHASDAGYTPLLAAASRGLGPVVRRLLAAGANPNRPGPLGETPLQSACFVGDGKTVRALLESGATVVSTKAARSSLLTLALAGGSEEAVNALLEHGAVVDPASADFEPNLRAALVLDAREFLVRALAAGMPPTASIAQKWPAWQIAETLPAPRCAQLLAPLVADRGGRSAACWVPLGEVGVRPRLQRLDMAIDPRSGDPLLAAEERVAVEVVIDEAGAVQLARASSPDARVNREAAAAAYAARFRPAESNGAPVATRATIQVRVVAPNRVAFDPADLERAPEVTKTVNPVYPDSARAQKISGMACVRVRVAADGQVTDLTVVSSNDPRFDEPALTAVRQWKFKPGTKGGEAVAVTMLVPVHFIGWP